MDEEIAFYLLTIKKDSRLFANVYDDEARLREDIHKFSEKYPVRLFSLTESFGNAYDLAVADKDGSLVVCLGPKKEIPDSAKNIIKCKKKEIDINKFLEA
jgi:hypothetical protein